MRRQAATCRQHLTQHTRTLGKPEGPKTLYHDGAVTKDQGVLGALQHWIGLLLGSLGKGSWYLFLRALVGMLWTFEFHVLLNKWVRTIEEES